MAILMDGKALATQSRLRLKQAIAASSVRPELVLVRVGDDLGSQAYVRLKQRLARQVGIHAREAWLPAGSPQTAVEEVVQAASHDPRVDGVLVQLPLPGYLDQEEILSFIALSKDVDGLTTENLGALASSRPGWIPAAVLGIMQLLDEYQVGVSGKQVVVLGLDRFLGIPLALTLSGRGAMVAMVPEEMASAEVTRQADVLVAALGPPEAIAGDWIKPGAVVIDLGNHRRSEGDVVGNVCQTEVFAVAAMMTPVPGGVGPMIIAALLENTWACSRLRRGKEDSLGRRHARPGSMDGP